MNKTVIYVLLIFRHCYFEPIIQEKKSPKEFGYHVNLHSNVPSLLTNATYLIHHNMATITYINPKYFWIATKTWQQTRCVIFHAFNTTSQPMDRQPLIISADSLRHDRGCGGYCWTVKADISANLLKLYFWIFCWDFKMN